jgi:acid phosphatase
MKPFALVVLPLFGLVSCTSAVGDRSATQSVVDAIDTVVVIYAENRAFDNLFGLFPGADGIPGVNPSAVGAYVPQVDRDGSVLATLPRTWGGLTAPGQSLAVTEAQTEGLPNRPFQVDGVNPLGIAVPLDVTTRDLVHRYYNNIVQIDGGRNDGFAAWSDAGGLAMGYYDGSRLAMWQVARRYTLADHFFMGAFGGSFLNHQYLVCACAPVYPNADAPTSPAKNLVSQIETDAQGRVRLVAADNAAKSALAGPPRYRLDGALTPRDGDGKFYAINTMQPAYQPSGIAPAAGGDARLGDPAAPTTLPPQAQATIGDRLDAKGVSWAWYGGAWKAASAGTPEARAIIYKGTVQFQPHHQPFNYYTAFDPATRADYRARHLRDFESDFLADAAAGRLPAVSFYKPQGNLNQHPGYANLSDGDAHIASVVAALEKSPQWPRMLVVVTYDENGGFWDHAPVPKADRWGPGTRVPAIIVSPLAKKGFVDKTPYDTASVLRFVTRRWKLEPLAGVELRDRALVANGQPPMGDLSAALEGPR